MSQASEEDSAGESEAAHGGARRMVEQACVLWESDLKAFLLGVLRNHHHVDDIFQKTVIRAIGASESVSREHLRGWLFRVALNEARQFLRECQRDLRNRNQLMQQMNSQQLSRLKGEDSEWMISSGALNADAAATIQRSLLRLPEEQQDVIRRRIYLGQTFAEIAAEKELPLGTVLTWMRRGLMKLREDSGLRSFWDH